MRRLTDDLLELSANRPLALVSVDLERLLREAAKATETAFPGIQVALETAPVPATNADEGRLRQVFLNLLTNAAQAQGTGTVQVSLGARREELVVRIHDNGPGVPEDLRARLFEGTTTKETGSGLGLALSRRLIERHRGSLRFVSDAPGATFEVVLPLQPPLVE